MPTRILLADDHQLLMDGLIAIIRELPDFEVMGTVNNGKQLLQKLGSTPCDMVLMDLNMPELDGIETLKILAGEHPALKVLVLSNYQQAELIQEVKALGAKGYIMKSISAPDLKEALRAVAQGQQWFEEAQRPQEETNSYFIDEFMMKYKLTKREVEIIGMIAEQLTSKEISDSLSISEFTVGTHRKNIMRKLQVRNMAGIISFANEHNLRRRKP